MSSSSQPLSSNTSEVDVSREVLAKLDAIIDDIHADIQVGRQPRIVLSLSDPSHSRFDVTTQRLRAGSSQRRVVRYTSSRFRKISRLIDDSNHRRCDFAYLLCNRAGQDTVEERYLLSRRQIIQVPADRRSGH